MPMSAPSITAKAEEACISPRLVNDAIISAVAVLLCTTMVTPIPASRARRRLETPRLTA